ncbi:E7 [Equus caballus papillomavirus 8]|uniref:Protein E7 n=1 Tax=Equus caballus papillomavirus 8 TaxID=1912759 RepID=A0A1D9EPT7_9PAPI|nr:E7 [Equus caballus papillomavirus 8]AOY65115.1 E7 [Equus caballus papillomavirus 8]
MRGRNVTLRDIVLEERPQLVDLHCDEQLPPEEEEEEVANYEEVVEVTPYRVALPCGVCASPLRLFIQATDEGRRGLELLLFRDLAIICPSCARNETRHE